MKRYSFLKLLSLLAALLLVCAIFASCNGEGDATDQNDGSEQGSETDKPINVEGLAVFGNNEYLCKIIRAEKASDVDKQIYSELRQILKTATGKNSAMSTDFVGLGETLDTESPAILIGRTAYPESQQVYDKMEHGEYRMELVGNKFVIAYSHEASAPS